jgi:hypothetical protein
MIVDADARAIAGDEDGLHEMRVLPELYCSFVWFPTRTGVDRRPFSPSIAGGRSQSMLPFADERAGMHVDSGQAGARLGTNTRGYHRHV